jgi:hypothetical protein
VRNATVIGDQASKLREVGGAFHGVA